MAECNHPKSASQKKLKMSSKMGRWTEKSIITLSAPGAHGVQDPYCSKQSHTTNLAVGTGL